MNMKRWLSVLLTSTLLLGCCAFSGCGDNTAEPEATDDTAPVVDNNDNGDDGNNEEEIVVNPKVLDGAKLVVFGDSLTAFGTWPLTAAEETNMYLFNGATGGINTDEALERFDKYVAAQDPDFVTLCFGQNDLLMQFKNKPQVTPENFKANLKTMCEKIVELDATPILMTCSYMNESIWWSSQGQNKAHYTDVGTPTEWLEQYCEAVRELAEEGNYDLVDIRKACDEYKPSEFLTDDGVHLGPVGNKVFAKELADYLKSHYTVDPNAEKIQNRYPHVSTPAEPATTPIISFDAADWDYDERVIAVENNDNGDLVFYNFNSQWPDAQYAAKESVYAPLEGTELVYDFSTAQNVSTSILLFFNGATPSAPTEGKYIKINTKLNVTLNSAEDIVGGQDCTGSIKLEDLGLPADAVDEHGNVLISGAKIYAAGGICEEVTVRQLAVSTVGAPNE